jgi:protein SCO1
VPTNQVLEPNATLEDLVVFVHAVRLEPERRESLIELLPERHSLYTERTANETTRMRGAILAAFEELGLPDHALIYAIEELETGRDAYLVAAAAKALRGLDTRERRIVPFLFRAINNMRLRDDLVTFDGPWPQRLTGDTTALIEIFRTFEWLGPNAIGALPQLEAMYADTRAFSPDTRAALARAIGAIRDGEAEVEAGCCGPDSDDLVDATNGIQSQVVLAPRQRRQVDSLQSVEMEDQDGSRLTYREIFTGRPTIVAFFYTRCDNPNKCSLTITKLARLQHAIAKAGLGSRLATAAITYDPGFDLPARLRSYGLQRGAIFDDRNRFFRTTGNLDPLKEPFELGVNFGPAVVNRHRIELFILDERGRIAVTFSRLQWDVDDVLRHAAALLRQDHARGRLDGRDSS